MIEIRRVERAIIRQGARFLNRIFTVGEQEYCSGSVASYAGRFAIKEAVAKALGTGIGDMRWLDIEVVSDERKKPTLQLHNAAANMAKAQGLTQWSISLSHTDTHAIGFVVAIG